MQKQTLSSPAHRWLTTVLISAVVLLALSATAWGVLYYMEIRSKAFTAGWPAAGDWEKITENGNVVADEEEAHSCDDQSIGAATPTGESDIASQAVCQTDVDHPTMYNPGNNGQPNSTDENTYSAGWYYYDPSGNSSGCSNLADDFLYFRLRLADNLITEGGGPNPDHILNNVWYAIIDFDGDEIPDRYVRVDGFGDDETERIEVLSETTGDLFVDGESVIWTSYPSIDLLADGYVRAYDTGDYPTVGNKAGDLWSWLEWKIPLSALGNNALCEGDTFAFQNFTSSEHNNQNPNAYHKDCLVPVPNGSQASATSEFIGEDTETNDLETEEMIQAQAANPPPTCPGSTDPVVLGDNLADLGITKTANDTAPLEGSTITYEIVVTNYGPDTATGIVVTDTIPTGTTFVSDDGGATTTGPVGDTLTWNVGSLTFGSSATLHVTVQVEVGSALICQQNEGIDNTATITSGDNASGQENSDSATETICPEEQPQPEQVDLLVEKTVDDNPVAVDQAVKFTITITNLSDTTTATNVEVTDCAPTGTTFVSANPSQGSYTQGTCVWTIGSLTPAQVVTLELNVTVNSDQAGNVLENTAVLTKLDQQDTNTDNNSDTETVDVEEPTDDTTTDIVECGDDDAVGAMIDCSQKIICADPDTCEGFEVFRDDVFFDAYTSIPYATKHKLAMLATPTNSLAPEVVAEINRILNGRKCSQVEVVINGRERAVSKTVEDALIAMGCKPNRIGGLDREETAFLISNILMTETPSISKMYLAERRLGLDNFSISSPAATVSHGGILLTARTGDNPDDVDPLVIDFIINHPQITQVDIAGGPAAVPAKVVQQILNVLPPGGTVLYSKDGERLTFTRYAGMTRTETNAFVNNKFFTNPTQVSAANGFCPLLPNNKHSVCHYFLLAAARIAALNASPMVFVDSTGIDSFISGYLTSKAPFSTGYIVGNLQYFPQAVRDQFLNLID